MNPDLVAGGDSDWWLEVLAVLVNNEMPPPDTVDLASADRALIVDWLSEELRQASQRRRGSAKTTSFRRLTKYELNYALQDLLAVDWDFTADFPDDVVPEEGFRNSSEVLQISAQQVEACRQVVRDALYRAFQPEGRSAPRVWDISMAAASRIDFESRAGQIAKVKQKHADDPEAATAAVARLEEELNTPPNTPYYLHRPSGRIAKATWSYPRARYALAPASPDSPAGRIPENPEFVAVIPSGHRRYLTLELGNQLPDTGLMKVRVRAAWHRPDHGRAPSLQLHFGWQASNEGRAQMNVGGPDVWLTDNSGSAADYEWTVALGDLYPRNSVRESAPMGQTPSPSEYIRLVNSSASAGDIRIEYVRVEAPLVEEWPTPSYRRFVSGGTLDENDLGSVRATLTQFMQRAWRRSVTDAETERKLELFRQLRPHCETADEALIEVLVTIVTSPDFLYVRTSGPNRTVSGQSVLNNADLATRLSLFLWGSLPDDELREVAAAGRLEDPEIRDRQVDRLLNDPRSTRFVKHFVEQWLHLEILEYRNLNGDFRGIDPQLKDDLLNEPAKFFHYVMQEDLSLLCLLHSDFVIVTERLARHYGLPRVYGNHFRRVPLPADFRRGGILTQAGPLTMNGDKEDSHPLKRGIWLLKSVLDDPPAPPPPAVPQIDVADPRIAEMTLRQRLEDHRSQPACYGCHAKIDPWGIALENYDGLGRWRNQIRDQPVDASAVLFNEQQLDGVAGLKKYLLLNRQDQFVRSLTRRLAEYALGRPLTFSDYADLEAIAAETRRQGDGLQTLIRVLVRSELFRRP